MLETYLNHCSDDRIAADFARSEALGAAFEALEAVGAPSMPQARTKRYETRWVRKANLLTGEVTYTQVTEEI